MDGIRCSQCDATDLELGFVSDFGQGALGVAQWVTGELRYGLFGIAKTRGRAKHPVTAYRCPQCSHLELFAW